MSRFIVTLTDERREKLEQLRISLGLRSAAATIQHLIDFGQFVPPPGAKLGMRGKGEGSPLVDIPIMPKAEVDKLMDQASVATPVPMAESPTKPGFKSRLKGEWSPPGKKR